MKKITLFLAIIVSLSILAEQKNGIVYVKAGATGTGETWSNALGDIQAAISLAKTDNLLRKDVWVASGEYTISVALTMSDSVNVYGGFAGTETDLAERAKVVGGKPWQFVNVTLLTGNGNRLVETSQNFDMETTFGGFTLSNGNGVGTQLSNNGGAVVVRNNMTLLNCIVKNSTATGNAGGVNMTGGNLLQCWVYGNQQQTGTGGGGGVYVNTSSGNITTIENCQINNNLAGVRGAGINIQGSGMTYCSNLRIFNNRAMAGTTFKPGGAIYTNSASNQIKNCLIYNNSGTNAIYYNGGNLYNNTIVKNAGGLYLAGNIIIAVNNIIWACSTDSTGVTPTSITGAANANSTVQNNATYNPLPTDKSWTASDNILFSSNASNGDVIDPAPETVGSGPKFAHVTRFIGAASTEDQLLQLDSVNWSLPIISPCVNVGKAVADVTTDFTGIVRPQGFPTASALYDMGAYELPYYTVVAGESSSANGAIYSALGIQLTENYTYGYAKGAKIELFFQPSTGYIIDRAYYTESTDGGITFTGEEIDFTSLIDMDGFWTSTVNSSFKVSVIWKSLTAVPELSSDKVRCIVSTNGVELIGLNPKEKVSVYQSNGILTNQSLAQGNQLFIPLSKGIYIIHTSEGVKKLIIK